METKKEKLTGLPLLRAPFPEHLIGRLPKPTKPQTDCPYSEKRKCTICNGFHHPKVVHLDYVGHAALTDRLLDADPNWEWNPLAFDEKGLPLLDKINGLWIKLTVCGQSRLGYGSPDGKTGGNAIKEAIGDALRNAAMRFGAALDLWHKGDLHQDQPDEDPGNKPDPKQKTQQPIALPELTETHDHYEGICEAVMKGTRTVKGLSEIFNLKAVIAKLQAFEDKRDQEVKEFLENKEVK